MERKFLMVFALGISGSIFSLPLSAHHGNAAYDARNKITLRGTVTLWFWANPHCVLQFDVKDDSGQVLHWGAETENPTTMSHQGWTKESFKPGDEITVTMISAKNGKPIGRILEVVLSNGQRLAGRVLPVLESSKPEDYPKQ